MDSQVIIYIVAAVAGFLISCFSFVKTITKTREQVIKSETADLTEIKVKLDHLSIDLSEIKQGLVSAVDQQSTFADRVTRVEESLKSAHKRIDNLSKEREK